MEESKQSMKYVKKSVAKMGGRNGMWKGDKAGIQAIHIWIRSRLGKPELCNRCHKSGWIDLANISQKYKRELTDWEFLCRKCHMESDGRLQKFLNNKYRYLYLTGRKNYLRYKRILSK